MKPEEIKIGGVYDVRVKVMKKIPAPARGEFEIGAYTVDRTTQLPMEYEMSWFLTEEAAAFVEITHENSVKNSEPAPKYDPCRLYREGDKVRYVKRNGRFCPGSHAFEEHLSLIGTVVTDEQRDYFVVVNFGNEGDNYLLDPAYLELETPVEELEPYKLIDSPNTYNIVRDSAMVMTIHKKSHPTAKEAAESECARLNEAYRKEVEK